MILDFPKQFRVGLKSAKNLRIENRGLKIENLIICGMGGSALPGDILKMFLRAEKIDLPVKIYRNYGLPYYVGKRHLIICISYSGDTEETLTAFEQALRKKIKIVAISSGGKLAKLCKKYKVPVAIIPRGYQPRMALGFQIGALMQILADCGLIKNCANDLLALEKNLQPHELESQGKKIAKKIKDKLPIIYAPDELKELARIWKIKFNENSKTPAFYNFFPELNHNEHNQFEGNQKKYLSVIILRDATSHPRILKKIELTAKILKQRGVAIDLIDAKGYNIWNKIFSSILLADWASYYLALAYKVDPTPAKLNDEFKRRLK